MAPVDAERPTFPETKYNNHTAEYTQGEGNSIILTLYTVGCDGQPEPEITVTLPEALRQTITAALTLPCGLTPVGTLLAKFDTSVQSKLQTCISNAAEERLRNNIRNFIQDRIKEGSIPVMSKADSEAMVDSRFEEAYEKLGHRRMD